MSGHSHWASIKHKKGAIDAKKGKIFSKLARLIQSAARAGGGKPDANIALRYAIDEARAVSMPKENIERAIKKGTGELQGEIIEEITYEGYGPGGVAILIDVITDNRNRTAAEIRKTFEMHNGKMAAERAVSWQFEKKGLIVVDANAVSEDDLMGLVLDAGADNLERAADTFEVTTPVPAFEAVKNAVVKRGLTPVSAKLAMIPKATVNVDADSGRKLLRLLDSLEDHEDVQQVHSNFVMDDAVMSKLGAEA